MSSKHRPAAPQAVQSVVEWRYAKAHRYWDDCGKLVSLIEHEFPGLICQKLGDNGFEFQGRSLGVDSASFAWDRATITQANQGDRALAASAERFWLAVSTGLGISSPAVRIGHRTWLLFEMKTVNDANRYLEAMTSYWSLSPAALPLGTPMMSGTIVRTAIEPNGRRLRLMVDSGTMTVKNGDSHNGVIVDADIVVEKPREVPSDVAEFVRSNIAFLRDSVVPVFGA